LEDLDTDESDAQPDDINTNTSQYEVNMDWHQEAHYTPPAGGSRIISIKAQPQSLQDVIKTSICTVTSDAVFVTAYPNAVTIQDYFCEILKKSADNLNKQKLRDRFAKDRRFAEIISRVVSSFDFHYVMTGNCAFSWLSDCPISAAT
jgi:hypothetical protein